MIMSPLDQLRLLEQIAAQLSQVCQAGDFPSQNFPDVESKIEEVCSALERIWELFLCSTESSTNIERQQVFYLKRIGHITEIIARQWPQKPVSMHIFFEQHINSFITLLLKSSTG